MLFNFEQHFYNTNQLKQYNGGHRTIVDSGSKNAAKGNMAYRKLWLNGMIPSTNNIKINCSSNMRCMHPRILVALQLCSVACVQYLGCICFQRGAVV